MITCEMFEDLLKYVDELEDRCQLLQTNYNKLIKDMVKRHKEEELDKEDMANYFLYNNNAHDMSNNKE